MSRVGWIRIAVLVIAIGLLELCCRLGLIDQIAEAYHDLLDEQVGKVEVDLTVAQKLTPEIRKAFGFDKQILDYLIGQKVIMSEAKRLGLTYTKVARFSAAHTAEKLVIPKASR